SCTNAGVGSAVRGQSKPRRLVGQDERALQPQSHDMGAGGGYGESGVMASNGAILPSPLPGGFALTEGRCRATLAVAPVAGGCDERFRIGSAQRRPRGPPPSALG